MKIDPLHVPPLQPSEKEKVELMEFEKLILELNRRDIPIDVAQEIQEKIEALNSFSGNHKAFLKKIKESKKAIFDLLQKKLNLVPENYYTSLWTPLGMTVFGLSIGTALSVVTKNFSFIGIGLPIGLALGALYGKKLDEKAAREKRVLKLS